MILNSELITVLLLVLVLIVAGLFSFLETATVAISEYKLKALQEKHLWAKYAYKLKQHLNQVLIFSLFGNSLFNAIFTMLTTILVSTLLKNIMSNFLLPLTTIAIAFLIIIFSEALPKIIAAKSPMTILKFITIPLYGVFYICRPIIWVLDKVILVFTKFININHSENTSPEELKAIIADKSLPFKDKHRSILLNSIDIEKITIKEVLIPLRMVEAIDISSDIENIYKKIYTTHHTRIIVYNKTIDNIIGFIHVKDILSLDKNQFDKEELSQIVRPITFVNDFILVIRQIHRAQKYKNRIFVVTNEYGDISGIACLEDMLEMIFGDFTTESPQQKHLSVKLDDSNFIVDGAMLIRELNELHDLNIKFTNGVYTINGLVLKILNGIPNIGVCFKLDNLIFEVINVGDYWVERVKISFV